MPEEKLNAKAGLPLVEPPHADVKLSELADRVSQVLFERLVPRLTQLVEIYAPDVDADTEPPTQISYTAGPVPNKGDRWSVLQKASVAGPTGEVMANVAHYRVDRISWAPAKMDPMQQAVRIHLRDMYFCEHCGLPDDEVTISVGNPVCHACKVAEAAQ